MSQAVNAAISAQINICVDCLARPNVVDVSRAKLFFDAFYPLWDVIGEEWATKYVKDRIKSAITTLIDYNTSLMSRTFTPTDAGWKLASHCNVQLRELLKSLE